MGKKTGKNPTDRAKIGTKRSIETDQGGIPLAVAVEGANRPDQELLEPTLKASHRKVGRGKGTPLLCLDGIYDCVSVMHTLLHYGYTALLSKQRGKRERGVLEKLSQCYRWVVERTHSWLNRYRRLLVRWEKLAANYLAMLELACALTCFRRAEVTG